MKEVGMQYMESTLGKFNVGDRVVYTREGFEVSGTVEGYTVDGLVVVSFDKHTETHLMAERLLMLKA